MPEPPPIVGPVERQRWREAAAGDLAHTVIVARFDPAQFTTERFRTERIACPPHIAAAVRKRQAEYFHGRLCAHAALRHLGCAAIDIGTGEMREPLWPQGVVGSITHSRTIAAAIALPASRYQGVGIDIEEIPAPDAHNALLATVVSGSEQEIMRTADGIDFAISLTAVFSAKESFFKAVFGAVGRYFDFDALALERIDPQAGILSFKLRESLCTRWEAGQGCEISFSLLPDNHVATLFAW